MFGDPRDGRCCEQRAALKLKLGIALSRVSAWDEARDAFHEGVALLPDERPIEKATLHIYAAQAELWTMETQRLVEDASAALAIGEANGDKNIVHGATAFLQLRGVAAGGNHAVYETSNRMLSEGADLADPVVREGIITVYPQSTYWLGRYTEVIAFREQAASYETHSTLHMVTMPVIGLSLGAVGRYRDAEAVFAESLEFGRNHNIGTLLARSASMSVGNLMDTFDFEVAGEAARGAVELARSVGFPPTVASSTLDLSQLEVVRGDLAAAERHLDVVEETIVGMGGWHQWIFALRLSLAKARVASLAKRWDDVLEHANAAIELGTRVSRRKHVAQGLHLRAEARLAQDDRDDALADLREALKLAREMAYPAMIVRFGSALLALDGSDELQAEVRAAGELIAEQLDGDAKTRFEAAIQR